MVLLVVIPQGFEPWTHALEGRCSNPTELRNQTGRKVTQILANKQTLATFFNKNFQHAFKHPPMPPSQQRQARKEATMPLYHFLTKHTATLSAKK